MPVELDDLVTASRERSDSPHRSPPSSSGLFARVDDALASGPPAPLAGFVDAARENGRVDMADARARNIPLLRSRGREHRRRRVAFWLSIAAALLVAAGLGAWFGPKFGTQRDASSSPTEAVYSVSEEEEPGEDSGLQRPETESNAPKPLNAGGQPPAATQAPDSRPLDARPEPSLSRTRRRPPASEIPTRTPLPSPTLSQRLAQLDAEAQTAWRAGEHDRARKLFEEIVRLGERRRVVEVAFGELFTLARQTGKDEPDLWRRYLEKFPRGRHADDARAGLCQGRTVDRSECWRSYLNDFPDGAHARLARKMLEDGRAPSKDGR